MSLNACLIALAIANVAIASSDAKPAWFHVENVSGGPAPFDGVVILRADGSLDRCVHIYFVDNPGEEPRWMVDPSNMKTGAVDPQPLTPEALERAINWLAADAWLVTYKDGSQSVSGGNDYPSPDCTYEPLTARAEGGQLVAWFDPKTGDLTTDEWLPKLDGGAQRFTRGLYTFPKKAL